MFDTIEGLKSYKEHEKALIAPEEIIKTGPVGRTEDMMPKVTIKLERKLLSPEITGNTHPKPYFIAYFTDVPEIIGSGDCWNSAIGDLLILYRRPSNIEFDLKDIPNYYQKSNDFTIRQLQKNVVHIILE